MDPMTMMMVGQVASSIMGGYGKAEEAARQDMAFQQQEFQRQLEVDAKNAVIDQQNANRLINNRTLAISAARQLAAQQYEIDEGYKNSSRQLFTAFATKNNALKTNTAARNMATGVGTSAAIARMAMNNLRMSNRNLLQSKQVAENNAKTAYQNIIGKRELTMQNGVHFIPGVSPAGDPGSAIAAGWIGAGATIAGAALGGSATGKAPAAGGGG
jgi:hypothetical protein